MPTAICYKDGRVSSWGFGATTDDEIEDRSGYKEWFKTLLDPNEYKRRKEEDRSSVPRSHDEVRNYFRDFLRKLYSYIEKFPEIQGLTGGMPWKDTNVEFSFTVPTTWTSVGITKDYETIIREAGFGKPGTNHSVSVGLTEAEAAAVHTFKMQSSSYNVSSLYNIVTWLIFLKDGDILLIVDAGGGTTVSLSMIQW